MQPTHPPYPNPASTVSTGRTSVRPSPGHSTNSALRSQTRRVVLRLDQNRRDADALRGECDPSQAASDTPGLSRPADPGPPATRA